jgi:allophanate hydrolase
MNVALGRAESLHLAGIVMLTIAELRQSYFTGSKRPADVIAKIFSRIRAEGERPVWILLADPQEAIARANSVDLSLPFGGVPFAIKDNIDVAGMATTAGCPAFSYEAERTAPVVERLLEAGAILIGKTNMDQFATGLVGVRSPYGVCSSVFNARYISGGSSSGSAVAVAKGLCAFALGTDTAGSGRVPAAFNRLVGMKPTRGLLSTTGVVPACRSLDCVSIFAGDAGGAGAVWDIARGADVEDPFSRDFTPGAGAAPWLSGPFRFGIPVDSQLEFFGDHESPALYRQAAARLEEIGGVPIGIDFAVFREAADLLYSGPWVAERFAAVGDFMLRQSHLVHPVVRNIILNGTKYTAADMFHATYRLQELKKLSAEQWERIDFLLLPTAATTYTIKAVENDPVRLNSNLGHYTNFVNLMDLAAVAVPAGSWANGVPFGVSLIGPAFSDPALLALARRYLGEEPAPIIAPGCLLLAVVGAHLTGQPLNHQLTSRGARLVRTCTTAADYRLYALRETDPPKPALVWEEGFKGPGIEVELWAIPEDRFGGFVAAVPPPLAIGSLLLEDGASVKGFVCGPAGIKGAVEITQFGGWRRYLAQTVGVR